MQLEQLHHFLDAHRLAVLATIAPTGDPQSALVGIAISPQLQIAFDTLKSSRKYTNIKAHPRVSFVVGWEAEITVQYEGIATEPEGELLRQTQELYFQAWPEGREHLQWPNITWFLVQPLWIRYSDFKTGHIEELTFPIPDMPLP
ncbi:pyridoxamine 5'-phosphate oxidase family protein [Granulicella sp. L60]|uniref:pyridoxamine 5'-phosphate oxidase family protein n=1 Tax=Granulicella sp. L60 TaxID=1641866 RepID=UPI00131D7A76|nr:pyridoxamine 5'-phosphate oxidase family protein [Granulicella sp. L60]